MERTAVVTGAGSGIGRAIAQRLAGEGIHVVVASRDEPKGRATLELIERDGGAGTVIPTDVTDNEAVKALAARVLDERGPADVVVNNAGWDRIQPFLENTPDTWDRIVGTNYLGVVRVTHAFAPQLMERQGCLVNIASEAGRIGSAAGRAAEAVYAGTKAGVIGFTKSIAREFARYGVRANCVSPGATDTDLFHSQAEDVQEAIVRSTPIRRMARPEEIAEAVVFLASDRSSFTTGQVLSVSGGMTMVG